MSEKRKTEKKIDNKEFFLSTLKKLKFKVE